LGEYFSLLFFYVFAQFICRGFITPGYNDFSALRRWRNSQADTMTEQTLITPIISSYVPVGTVSKFRQEYLGYQALYRLQTTLVQRFLETQASSMAAVVMNREMQIQFTLPDHVILQSREEPKTMIVPGEYRSQVIGGLLGRLIHTDLRTALRSRLLELEQSSNQAISAGALLVRHALVMHMVHTLLPSGRSVHYSTPDGDDIPCVPIVTDVITKSALTDSSDARIFENESDRQSLEDLVVPYVEAARRFYLPQWISFDNNGNLLVASVAEAEAQIASMQHYLSVLHIAIGLAPYMVADEDYQNKRYGILGQLVNQGRALARYQIRLIIQTIQKRAAEHDLDRGLSISLPYFNDQTLMAEVSNFDVIPSGRIMFIPGFVVLAVRAQAAKIAQDTRFSPSTRRHLLTQLSMLEQAFLR
jgi:hypothetical protein